jgi:hypothetical protein
MPVNIKQVDFFTVFSLIFGSLQHSRLNRPIPLGATQNLSPVEPFILIILLLILFLFGHFQLVLVQKGCLDTLNPDNFDGLLEVLFIGTGVLRV